MQSRSSSYDCLQCLRAFGALGVFASHLALKASVLGGARLPHGAGAGVYGVDIFFVVSGFIMIHSTRDKPHGIIGAGRFLLARWARIFPPYWTVLAACLLIEGSWSGAITQGPTASLIGSVLLFPEAASPVLRSAWTLINESYFYAVFGVLMLAPRRWLAPALSAWALGILLAAASGWRPGDSVTTLFSNPLTLEFIGGAAVALFVEKLNVALPHRALPSAVIMLSGGLMWGVLLYMSGPADVPARVILVGLPAAGLVAALTIVETSYSWRAPRLLLWIGRRSYSLYLVNLPVCALVALLVKPLALHGAPAAGLYAASSVMAVTLTTALLYWMVERPAGVIFGRWLDRSIQADISVNQGGELDNRRLILNTVP